MQQNIQPTKLQIEIDIAVHDAMLNFLEREKKENEQAEMGRTESGKQKAENNCLRERI
jgi:hypothetical protein